MSDIFASIIESAVEAAASAAERRRSGAPPARRLPQPASARRVEVALPADSPPAPHAAPAAQAVKAPPLPPPPAPPERWLRMRGLLGSPDSLIRTVLAGEILGPPIALRRHNLWEGPGV